MVSKLSPFHLQPPITSSLLKNPSDAVPPIDELEKLHAELKSAKQRALERGRKAEEDLRTIEESMRRMTEKEKGKSKAVDKVKREHEFTPLPDAEDSRPSSYLGNSSKSRSHALSAVPSSSRASLDPRRSALEDAKKKKKKRKREGNDSDVESEVQRPHKISPPATHPVQHPPPPKPSKPSTTAAQIQNKSQSGPDFSVPLSVQLLPPRPPIALPPIPGPSKPTEVVEDFSKTKQPASTVTVSTFYTSIEPYIRNVKEEDVGFLEYTGDELEPFVMPKLGRHYLEIWEDQDMGVLPHVILGEPPTASSSSFTAPTPQWDPSTLTEADLLEEEKGHGPLTERVISALLPVRDSEWKGVKAAEDAMEGRPGGSGAAAARRERLNVTDLEARIRDMMRYHGLLHSTPDFTGKVDDPIATALRQAQRELRRVVATNKLRKARLIDIARDRLGYQEYLDLRDSIDKNITTLYAKLQKKDTPKLNKKKKKPLQGAAAAAVAAAAANAPKGSVAPEDVPISSLAPCPSALGLTPDEDNHLTVNEQLKQLVETRRQWVDTVGSIFEEKERECPGRIYGLPKESIYAGIDEEVEAMLSVPMPQVAPAATSTSAPVAPSVSGASTKAPTTNGMRNGAKYAYKGLSNGSHSHKGKERARGDAMDIG